MPRDTVFMMNCGILGVLEFQVNELFPDEKETVGRDIPSPQTEIEYLLCLEAELRKNPLLYYDSPSHAFCDSSGVYAAHFEVPSNIVVNDQWRPFTHYDQLVTYPKNQWEYDQRFFREILLTNRPPRLPKMQHDSHGKYGRQPRSRFDRETPKRA